MLKCCNLEGKELHEQVADLLTDNTKQNSARTNAAVVDGFEKSVVLRSSRNEVRSQCRVVSGFDHLRI